MPLSAATVTHLQLVLEINLAGELEDRRFLTDNKINSSDSFSHVPVESYHPKTEVFKLKGIATSLH